MVDAKRLRMLVEVARAGSFSGAAAALDYTPGAIWQQIRALEAQAGQPLVVRHRSGAELTVAGQALVQAAEPALDHLHAIEEHLATLRRQVDGWVGVVASTDAASAVVAGALAQLSRAAPEVGVEVAEHTPPRCLNTVATGGADVAVVAARPALLECPAPLTIVCAEDEPRIVVFPAGDPLAALAGCDLETLARATTPLLGTDGRGAPPGVFCPNGSAIALLAMVQRGLGAAVLPGMAATVLPAGTDWFTLDEEPRRRVVVATSRVAQRRAGVPAVIRALRDDLAAHAERWLARSGRRPRLVAS
jgi:molybdate transport repressor ModE-like protein